MINVGVVGATGYTGEEIVEVLLRNKEVEITSLTALVDKEMPFSEMYPKFDKKTSLICKNLDIDEVAKTSDLVFLALPHTVSMQIAPEFFKKGKRVIDLSADYRLPQDVYEKWYATKHTDVGNLDAAVYGLPELNAEKIKDANLIANPGCFPTSVILGLLPIAKETAGKDIIIDAKTGVTGAGRKALIPLVFGEVDEDLKCYKANEHQHMPEMEYILSEAASAGVKVNFVPHLLPVKRGIFSTMYIKNENMPDIEEIYKKYTDCYENKPFVRVRKLGDMPQLKDVVGSNFCDIGIKSAGGMILIVTCIDNLLKGASGQAVQNMNIMYGLDETLGLV